MATIVDVDRWRRGALFVGLALGLVAGCTVGSGFPDRSGAGVLTTRGGTMYLVINPCDKMTVDEIALQYVPRGATPDAPRSDRVVVRYEAESPVPAADVLAPLVPTEDPPTGWRLIELDEEALADALASERASTFDDRFYVEAVGHLEDGTPERLGGSWSADVSQPDTAVLRSEILDDPFGRRCRDGVTGWATAE